MPNEARDCPLCGSPLTPRERLGHAARYECSQHKVFKVSDTAESLGFWSEPVDTQARALKNAIARARPGEEPLITDL